MTAGSGLLHIEAPPESLVMSGGLFHGLQLWVNLPAKDKMMAPRYQDIRGGHVQLLTTPDGGALLRVIAGELDGHQGPGITHTPITMIHATLRARRARSPCRGARTSTPSRTCWRAAARSAPSAGRSTLGQTAVFGAGASLTVRADEQQDSHTPDLEVVLLGGQPIREPMAHYGPFVMNTQRGAAAGLRGLPEGPAGHDPRRARDVRGRPVGPLSDGHSPEPRLARTGLAHLRAWSAGQGAAAAPATRAVRRTAAWCVVILLVAGVAAVGVWLCVASDGGHAGAARAARDRAARAAAPAARRGAGSTGRSPPG